MPPQADSQPHGEKHARKRLVVGIVGEAFAVSEVVRPAFRPVLIFVTLEAWESINIGQHSVHKPSLHPGQNFCVQDRQRGRKRRNYVQADD